ncbi:hypothetical protein F5146DRAFT_1144018 [Armillaria mellea]|nr:hypothetical protein F5146DRAFT_1144018 [Armillaria mellea]
MFLNREHTQSRGSYIPEAGPVPDEDSVQPGSSSIHETPIQDPLFHHVIASDLPESTEVDTAPGFYFDHDTHAPVEHTLQMVDPTKHVRHPTSKVLATLEEALPKGPGELDIDPSPSDLHPWLRVLLHRPTSIPDMGTNAKEYITPHETMDDHHCCKILDIIFLYPNLSSFYFNFWNKHSDKKTKEDRKFIQGIITDPDFSNKDVCGVNFNKINDQLAKDMKLPWGSNG